MSSETRRAIVNAANEVFIHFGYKKASIEDIARAAGIGKGTVYLHFASKEALFEAVIHEVLTKGFVEIKAKVEAATSPESRLRAFIDERMVQGIEMFRFGFGGLFPKDAGSLLSLAESVGAVKRVVVDFRERESLLLGSILEEGRDSGVFHITDAPTLAKGLLGVIYASIASVHTGGDEARRSLTAVLEIILRGLMTKP